MGIQGGWCEEKEENVWEIEKHRVTFSRERELEEIICH
jgi:hypothetical protein